MNSNVVQVVEYDESQGAWAGVLTGAVAAMVMGLFAMIASATYQHRGFFTPLYHISAFVGSPRAMTTSMERAVAGDTFWFDAGAASVGLLTHLITGAVFGAGFAGLTHLFRRGMLVPAGAIYGMVVFVLSPFGLLPLAAAATGAGDVISEMASMVGWSTFAIEHGLYGVTLGVAATLSTRQRRMALGRYGPDTAD